MTAAFKPGEFDGIERTDEAERRINGAIGAALNSPAGSHILDYLRSITINAVSGPGVSSDALRHKEGQRYIVSVLINRFNAAKEGR